MKKHIALILVLVLLTGLFSGCTATAPQASPTQSEDVSGMTTAEYTMYVGSVENTKPITLGFLDGQTDIPYISVEEIRDILMEFANSGIEKKVDYTITEEGKIVTLTRENGSAVEFDFDSNEIRFYNLNTFFANPFASTALDFVSLTGFDENGEPAYISRSSVASFERDGDPIQFILDGFDIKTVYQDGTGYTPLQTFSDLFLSKCGSCLLYNGEAVFIVLGDLGDMEELYYSAPTGERSEALAIFNYNELRLVLDAYYGLKSAHNIDDFAHLFEQTGLDEQLKSTDPLTADKALSELCLGYFADMHSGFLKPSFYAGKDAVVAPGSVSSSVVGMVQALQSYSAARAEYFPNGVPAYQEIGNTAYVTFDAFSMPTQDYYETPATAESTDTFGIIQYAHSQIMREGSPVENVVIDLSNNGGGAVDAAVYVVGWFLGSSVISIEDTLTDAKSSTRYLIDANGDRVFDEKDTVASKNLYCVTSQCSFSCGNLVPCAFKSSGRVTLLGKASGGGACCVMHISTADGSLMQISGSQRMSTVVNGSYHDVDNGVEPDCAITKLSHFYDRSSLTSYINSLY